MNAATEQNKKHAWQKSKLFPIEPQVVFQKLGFEEPQPLTPPNITVTASNSNFISIPCTSGNVAQVNLLEFSKSKPKILTLHY